MLKCRQHFWTLPQKKPQLTLLFVSSSALSFARLSCLQPADVQEVSAVSLLSYRCALALLLRCLHLSSSLSRCEHQPLLNSLCVRYFKTSVAHSRRLTITHTHTHITLVPPEAPLLLFRGGFGHGENSCVCGIGDRGGREVGERLASGLNLKICRCSGHVRAEFNSLFPF